MQAGPGARTQGSHEECKGLVGFIECIEHARVVAGVASAWVLLVVPCWLRPLPRKPGRSVRATSVAPRLDSARHWTHTAAASPTVRTLPGTATGTRRTLRIRCMRFPEAALNRQPQTLSGALRRRPPTTRLFRLFARAPARCERGSHPTRTFTRSALGLVPCWLAWRYRSSAGAGSEEPERRECVRSVRATGVAPDHGGVAPVARANGRGLRLSRYFSSARCHRRDGPRLRQAWERTPSSAASILVVVSTTAPLSDLLRSPSKVIEHLDKGDVVLTRRGGAALRLSLDTTATQEREMVAALARLIAATLTDDTVTAQVADALRESFPWVDFLDKAATAQFVGDFLRTARACASVGRFERLGVEVANWKETAVAYSLGLRRRPDELDYLTEPVKVTRHPNETE